MVKRLCLFAGYSKNNIIEDYVVYYIKELSLFADVYYCADCNINEFELNKLSNYVKKSIAYRHKKYDFWSWAILLSHINNINDYDEILLINDSVYGPLFPLKDIFEKMKDKEVSAWSVCGNLFMMSFFIVLKREVFLASWFKDFMDNIKNDLEKNDIVRLYEKGLSKIIEQHNLKWDCAFSSQNLKAQIKEKQHFIQKGLKNIPLKTRICHRFRFNKIRLYDDDYFALLLLGFPFIKKQAFGFYSNNFNLLAPIFIKKYSHYDYNLIANSLEINNITQNHLSLRTKIIKNLKNFIFEKKYKGKGIVYKIFKIKIYTKKHSI